MVYYNGIQMDTRKFLFNTKEGSNREVQGENKIYKKKTGKMADINPTLLVIILM